MRKIISGSVDKSYGIQVAKMAGIPSQVIKRADEILRIHINSKEEKPKIEKSPINSDLYNRYSYMIDDILNVDIDSTTPLEALQFIKKIKSEYE